MCCHLGIDTTWCPSSTSHKPTNWNQPSPKTSIFRLFQVGLIGPLLHKYAPSTLITISKLLKLTQFLFLPWLLPSGPQPPGSIGTWCRRLQEPAHFVSITLSGVCLETWRTALASRTAAKVLLIWFLISVALSTLSLWSSLAWLMAYSWIKFLWKKSKRAKEHVFHLLHIVNLLLGRCHLSLKGLALFCKCVPVSCVVLQQRISVQALNWIVSPSDRRAFSLRWSLCFPTAPSSPSVSPQGSPLVYMLFHLSHLVSICAAHRGLWHALQLLSLGDDCLHVILLFVNLVHHLQVLLNDVLCGRDRTCRKIMTTWNRYSKIYGSVAESEKNKKNYVNACKDLAVSRSQLLVGELHQGHQVVRVLRNNCCQKDLKYFSQKPRMISKVSLWSALCHSLWGWAPQICQWRDTRKWTKNFFSWMAKKGPKLVTWRRSWSVCRLRKKPVKGMSDLKGLGIILVLQRMLTKVE